MVNPNIDPATLGFDRYPPLAGRNSKQIQMTKIQNPKRFEHLDIQISILFRASDF